MFNIFYLFNFQHLYYLFTVLTFFIRHYGGLCLSFDSAANRFKLKSGCDEFTFVADSRLKHQSSGKCVLPMSRVNNAKIQLDNDCTSVETRFRQTKEFSMKHLSSGKCIHPFGGQLSPAIGTDIVLYNECNMQRIQFKFVPVS